MNRSVISSFFFVFNQQLTHGKQGIICQFFFSFFFYQFFSFWFLINFYLLILNFSGSILGKNCKRGSDSSFGASFHWDRTAEPSARNNSSFNSWFFYYNILFIKFLEKWLPVCVNFFLKDSEKFFNDQLP